MEGLSPVDLSRGLHLWPRGQWVSSQGFLAPQEPAWAGGSGLREGWWQRVLELCPAGAW